MVASLGAAALANVGVLAIPNLAWAAAAALVLVALVPGGLLAKLIAPADAAAPAETVLIGIGLGGAALSVSGLLLNYLPVQLGRGLLLAWFDGLALVLVALVLARGLRTTDEGRRTTDGAGDRRPWSAVSRQTYGLLLVVALAAALRLPTLGYSEFQGDETEVVLRAVGVAEDVPDALYYHAKGPAEVLVTAVVYGLIGGISEASARLPFALASVAGIATCYLFGRRLLGPVGGLTAALLLAFDGYLVAFARIAQYQSVVFLMSALGVLCAVRWAAGSGQKDVGGERAALAAESGTVRWPVLAGAFVATGALAHYDAVWALPPIGLIAVWGRGGWRGLLERKAPVGWLAGGVVGLGLLLLFFGPYATSPLRHLAADRIVDRVGLGFPRNNLSSIASSAELYASGIYLLFVGLLVGTGLALMARRRASISLPLAAGLVWFALPFMFYAFVARKPGTHIHVVGTPLALLSGWTVARLWAACSERRLRAGIAVGLGVALALVGAYLAPVYLETTPELVRGNLLPSFPLYSVLADQVPRKERFGFPYQAGWKAVGVLYQDGWLAGSFDSNENPQITHWYTRAGWRCTANPRYYLIAENVQDEIEPPRRRIAAEYPTVGVITVGGQPKLRIHQSGAPPETEPTIWSAEALAERFDRWLSGTWLDPGVWARGPLALGYIRSPARFGDAIDLIGYQLFEEDPAPGGTVRIDLFWAPRISTNGGYTIDLEVGDSERIGDGNGPGCDKSRAAQEWTAGQPFVQRASVSIGAAAPVGTHPLLVGVTSASARGRRLPANSDLPTRDGLVQIGTLEIKPGMRREA